MNTNQYKKFNYHAHVALQNPFMLVCVSYHTGENSNNIKGENAVVKCSV